MGGQKKRWKRRGSREATERPAIVWSWLRVWLVRASPPGPSTIGFTRWLVAEAECCPTKVQTRESSETPTLPKVRWVTLGEEGSKVVSYLPSRSSHTLPTAQRREYIPFLRILRRPYLTISSLLDKPLPPYLPSSCSVSLPSHTSPLF